jgi:carbonic anhydrase
MFHPADGHPAWQRLLGGNHAWTSGRAGSGERRDQARRMQTHHVQHPVAAVLTCSDSRVPAEIVFGQGIGDLFVVRTAGHTVDTAVLGSLEYAVEVLNVPLLVVLGHTGCGAVGAAVTVADGGSAIDGHIHTIAEQISTHVRFAHSHGLTSRDAISGVHALHTIGLLADRSPVVARRLLRGALTAVAAVYDLASGVVTEVHADRAIRSAA